MGTGTFLELRPMWEALVALALGVLVGLEREHARIEAADYNPAAKGVRTFALIALYGYASALLAPVMPALPLVALIGLSVLLSALHIEAGRAPAHRQEVPQTSADGKLTRPHSEDVTTEVAALLVAVLGMLVRQALGVAVMIGLFCAIVLIAKPWVRGFVVKLRRAELLGTLQLLLACLIVLPVVPNHPLSLFPPLDNVINPRSVVLFILLVAAVGYVGYVLTRIFGPRRGLSLAGLIGGMTSSTAVTLAMGERVRDQPNLAGAAAQATTLAYAVMMLRVQLVTFIIFAPLGRRLLLPALLMAAGYLVSFLVFIFRDRSAEKRQSQPTQLDLKNPFELWPAVKFGLLYLVVVVATKVARAYLGVGGFYVAAGLAGLADVDSILLAAAKLVQQGGERLSVGLYAILIAVAANTAAKTAMAWWSGGRDYGLRILLCNLPAMLLGVIALLVG